MGHGVGDGGGGNCTRVDLGKSLTICLRSKAGVSTPSRSLSGTSVPPVNHAQDARVTFKLHHVPSLYLALPLGNITRSGAAFSSASSFLIRRVLTRPASRGCTR